jgi:hypothetical protein
MKNIIFDHLWRWRRIWLLCILVNCALALIVSTSHNKFCVIYPGGMFMGAMLLSFDMQRGFTRSILIMPLTAKQVGQAWWWVAVGLPAAAITLTTALMFTLSSCWRQDWSGLPGCAFLCLSNLLTLGVGFYALTGLPRAGASFSDWGSRLRGYLFGGLWGISYAGWIVFQNMALNFKTGLGLLVAAICLTIMGWFRAELLVRERAGTVAGSSALRVKSANPSRSTEGYGGLAFLAQNIFTRMVYMGVWMFAAFAIILPLMNTFTRGSAKVDFMGDTFPIFSFQFLWVMTFQVAAFTMNIRYLRTMPVSSTKLAGMLVFTTLAALLLTFYGAMLLLSAVFQAPLPGPEKIIQQGILLEIAMATAVVPLFLWRPMEKLTFVIMMLMMGGGMFAIFFKQNLPPVISVAASVVIIVGVFVATKTLLERSSRAYRPRMGGFGAWNMGGGR